MDIRKTLKATQAATFAVLLPSAEHHGMPVPTGTGFFISPVGVFVTARHVIADPEGNIRDDIGEAWLEKEMRDFAKPPALCQWPELIFEDEAADVAVLRLDFRRNREKSWLHERKGFPYVAVGLRPLEEGEPVYSFGYPLGSAEVQADEALKLGTTTLRPRVTSALVASTLEEAGPVRSSADVVTYVLDKALNYGNSGGPIVAVDTGHVHAVCTRFQPVLIPQPHLDSVAGGPVVIAIPSLYGVVSALSNPQVAAFLRGNGVHLMEK